MAEIIIPGRTFVAGDQKLEAIANAAGNLEQAVRIAGGAGPANETGNLTAAQPVATTPVAGGTVGGTVDYSSVGNVTVVAFGAAHAGYTVMFEGSPDGGTTWIPLSGQDELTNVAAANVLMTANTAKAWSLSLFGFNRFRVRASTRTSGTLSVIMAPGTILIEPVVSSIASNPAGSVLTVFRFQGAAVTTEALASLTPNRGGTDAAAATSHTITAGKTLRLISFNVAYRVGAAAVGGGAAYLRYNSAGAVTATSPLLMPSGASANAAVSGAGGGTPGPVGEYIEIPGGWQIGVSHVGHATTANIAITVVGIEY